MDQGLQVIVALLLLFCGDTLHLKGGGKVEGKILSSDDKAYRVQVATGTVTIPKDQVERVELGPSPAEILAERRAKLEPKDAKAALDLAKWALSKGFTRDALDIARAVDDPGCREFVAATIEPEVRRRLDEAQKAFKLGLTRRGRQILDDLVRDYPEAKARAVAPADTEPARPRVTSEAADAVNAWFEKGTAIPSTVAIKEALAAIRFGAKPSGGKTGASMQCKTAEGVPYLLRVPAGYDPSRPMRLLISLHGSGGTAAMAMACWRDGFEAEKDLIVAAPEGGLPGWGNSHSGHDRILGVVRDVAARYAVDLDRVCLEGGSMGAHGSFFLCMYYPDRFAAIAPRCGSARFVNQKSSGGVPDISAAPAILDNLWRTPVYLIAGVKDGNSPIDEVRTTKRRLEGLGVPLVYREYPEGGHDWFPAEDRDVLDFLRAHRRDPYPTRVKFTTREPAFGRAYWIEIVEATRPLRIEITHVDMNAAPIETRREYEKPVEVDAECDRAKNRVTIKAPSVRELKVRLADELLDLDKPVRILLNGDVVFDGKVERSLQAALDDCKARKDRGLVYPVVVTVRAK
jgi:hypothetical protein